MKNSKKFSAKYTVLLALMLLTPMIIAAFMFNSPIATNLPTEENEPTDPFSYDITSPEIADVYYPGQKYDLSEWWNKTYRYRIGFELVELENIDRYQPVDIYFTFRENEHYENTERLLSYNATGSNEWSDPIPIQVWNVTKYPATNFIESCTMTFIADVAAGTNQTYFLYYNENNAGIESINYGTNFNSQLIAGTLTVTVGTDYSVVLEEGLAVTELIKSGINFHTDESLSPEKELSHPDLRFLAHCDENQGTTVSDSTGNVLPPGDLRGNTAWTTGIVRYGLEFDGTGDDVNFGAALESPGDPFSDTSTAFTITAWLRPTALTSGASNHQTQNCFMAKASDPYNDNFEVGINVDGTIHVYIDTEQRDTYDNFGVPGAVSLNQWNFVAIRFDAGDVDVRINDVWYPTSTAWSGATDMDQAVGSLFTLGSTDHINTYFTGVMDEVVIYNTSISNTDIEEYKYASSPSTIQSITEIENGDVFSQYVVDWTNTFDMHVQDTCTFYYDYNLWSITRGIYFDGPFDPLEAKMIALNTYYDFSSVDDLDQFKYLWDGNIQEDLTNVGVISPNPENYTIIHNTPDPSKDTLGIIISGVELSDPAHTSISYLRGDLTYMDDIVEFTPGTYTDFDNSVGNESHKLFIYFWEFIDSLNQTGSLTDTSMVQYFEDTLMSLKDPMDIYIYDQDSFFYNLEVNVTDIDDNLVPEATVTVWNASNHAINWTQITDENGQTVFNRLEDGDYLVNVSYVRYSQEISITTAQTVTLNETNVDTYGVYHLAFTDVQMTSIEATFQRIQAGLGFQEYIEGASITFTIDDGSGPTVLGSEYTDSNGVVVFRWANFSSESEGNITLTAVWHGESLDDLASDDDLAPGDITSITLPFYEFLATTINATSGNTYRSFLTVNALGTENKILGESIFLWLNYSFQKNNEPINGTEGATVSYNIKIGSQLITTIDQYFEEQPNGNYSLTIDTLDPVEPGGVDWMSSITYTMEIEASKPGYITNQTSITFTLQDKTATLTPSEATIETHYNDMFNLDVHYEDVFSVPNEDIDGASVQYFVIGLTGITGLLTPEGSGGIYHLVLNSSEFPLYGDYLLQLTASKQNYETKSIFVSLKILEINTRLNGSAAIYEDYEVYLGTSQIFQFDYTVESSGAGLSGVSVHKCEWEKEDDLGTVLDTGEVLLTDLGNGRYELDLNTELLELATYVLMITLGETNYVDRSAVIFLKIVPRDFIVDVGSIVSVVSGNDLQYVLTLRDIVDNSLVTGADITMTLQGYVYSIGDGIVDNNDGTYTVTVGSADLPSAFFISEVLPANISVTKANYTDTVKEISIEVTLVEIFPGFPMFYFLMIIGVIAVAIVTVIIYRTVQKAKIPKFVKKARDMKSSIKSRKSISDSLLYPTKEEHIVKKLGDRWEMLGISLADIMEVELGKRKKSTAKSEEKFELEGGEEPFQ